MIKIETQKNFNGFGHITGTAGEYFYSMNMKRTKNGIKPGWKLTSSLVGNYGVPLWFSERSDGIYFYTQSSGRVWAKSTMTNVHTVTGTIGGMIVDQKDRLLFTRDNGAGNRNLCSYDGTTWSDTFKTIADPATGETDPTGNRPMELYLDMVLIGNGNKVAMLNTTDDSYTDNAFQLPIGFSIVAIKAGKNGVLIGANFRNRGYLVLWDGLSNSATSPWTNLDVNVQSIATTENGWLVVIKNGVYESNGYTRVPRARMSGNKIQDVNFSGVVNCGTAIFGDYLVISNRNQTIGGELLNKDGIFMLNLLTDCWEFVPRTRIYNSSFGGVFVDSSLGCHIGYRDLDNTLAHVDTLSEGIATRGVYITDTFGDGVTDKTAEGVIVSVNYEPYSQFFETDVATTKEVKIYAKIYPFDREMTGYTATKATSSAKNKLTLDYGNATKKGAKVGDEVLIMNGSNALERAQITVLTTVDSTTVEATLDRELSNLTASGVLMIITPFKQISSMSISSGRKLYFDIKNRYKGKKFLVEIVIENSFSYIVPEITAVSLVYNDLGII